MQTPSDRPPHEHVIVFDEAQRAWDEKQGKEKFNRSASEPAMLLELMARHEDWCVCVCLVGGADKRSVQAKRACLGGARHFANYLQDSGILGAFLRRLTLSTAAHRWVPSV